MERRSEDGLGWRAKIGLLVPATNTICQPECEALKPEGVTNHVARMRNVKRGTETGDMDAYRKSLERDTTHIREAIEFVVPCRPDSIVLGHSIDTFRGGVQGAAGLRREMEECAGGVPVILPSDAFLAALRTLGIQPGARLSFLTPYWPPGDEQVESFFRDAGYVIGKTVGLKCPGALAIAATPAARVKEALKELAADRPDAIIKPGTNLAADTLAVTAADWFGLPVLSCNAVTYWHALRQLGIRDRRTGHGALFELH
jgi:maleate isomerase